MSLAGSYKKLGAENLKRIEQYVKRIEALLKKATGRFVDLSTSVDYDSDDGQFYFADYPELKREVDYLVNDLATNLQAVIMAGTTNEWKNGSKDANSMLDFVLETSGVKTTADLKDELIGQFISNHDSALKAFQKRRIGGMNLSTKVWDLSNKTKIETELARSIASGTSAQEIAESMKEFLKRPDDLYRRVRDEFGNLHLSKRARAYSPEPGVYRSSYKNALRLARTEINMSYRNAEWESWQEQDYVVGIQIHRSQTAYDCDVCESLAGRYPKTFKWNGWHPNCRCYMTPILLSQEEREKWTDAVLEGEEYDCTQSENYVGDVPDEFKEWVSDNTERIEGAMERGTTPYFIRDNIGYVKPYLDDGINTTRQQAFKWTAEKVDDLLDSGFKIRYDATTITGDEALKVFQECAPLSGFNVPKINRDVTSLCSEYGIELPTRKTLSVRRGDKFRLLFESVDVSIERFFEVKEGEIVVEHRLFELSHDFQGKGFSKKVFKTFLNEYEKAGVKRIELHANLDVGGYCWARYGFCTDTDTATALIAYATKLDKNLGMKFREAYDKYYKSHSGMFPLRLFTDIPGSKKALMGQSWDGVFYLDDKEAMDYLKGYLR